MIVRSLLVSVAIVVALSANVSFAASQVIEEIVVTAQKRAQSITEVPLAVQSFDGEDLERQGVDDLLDMLSLVPGASVPAVISPGTEVWQIRGIAGGQVIGEATVGAYLDEFAFNIPQQPFGPPANIFDIDRIEVLRGPQGTLYGQGSMGGTVKVVTANPELNEFSLRGRGSFSDMKGGGDSASGDIMVNVPLVEDTLAGRVAVSGSRTGGYADATLLGQENINDNDTISARAKLLWEPIEELAVVLQAWRFESEQGYTNRIDNVDPPQTNDTGPGETPADWTLYTATIEYDLGFAQLVSATGYMEQDRELLAIGSQPAFGNFDILTTNSLESFSQEVRLSSAGESELNWVAGVFYQDADNDATSDFAITMPVLRAIQATNGTAESLALFGEVSYDLLGGKLVPLVGVRYFEIDQTLDQNSQTFLDNELAAESTEGLDSDESEIQFRFNVSAYPNDRGMFYVNSAEGFRAGGLQSDSNVVSLQALGVSAEASLDPDSLWSHEVGTKWSLLEDRSLVAEVALYYIDWKDAQLQFSPAGISGILNVGDIEGKGIDVSLNYVTPIEGLSLNISGNWNATEFNSVDPALEAILPFLTDGEQIPGVPEYNFNLMVGYERPIGSFSLFADARYNYRDKQRDIVTGEFSDTIELLNAQIGIARDKASASLFVDNLTDERGPLQIASGRFVIPTPRQVGVRFSFGL